MSKGQLVADGDPADDLHAGPYGSVAAPSQETPRLMPESVKTLTPEAFAARQRLFWVVPGTVAIFAHASVLILFARAMVNMQSARERLELLLVLGLVAAGVGFVLWISLSFRFRGLLLAQRKQWRVSVIADEVELMSPEMRTAIPLRSIKTLAEVTTEAFTEIRGHEDRCLKLALQGGSTIIVPGSAEGYGNAVQLLKASLLVGFRSSQDVTPFGKIGVGTSCNRRHKRPPDWRRPQAWLMYVDQREAGNQCRRRATRAPRPLASTALDRRDTEEAWCAHRRSRLAAAPLGSVAHIFPVQTDVRPPR